MEAVEGDEVFDVFFADGFEGAAGVADTVAEDGASYFVGDAGGDFFAP